MKKPISIIILVLIYTGLFAQKSSDALRVDFFRSGNDTLEILTMKQVSMQHNLSIGKHAWIDSVNYGFYRIDAYNEDGELFFRRGYSSLFNEWRTTDEAKIMNRSFEESVLIPFIEGDITLKFFSRDFDTKWNLQYAYSFNSQSVQVVKKSYHEYPVEDLKITGSEFEKLDILIIPDGYTADEMEEFKNDAMLVIKGIMASSPFIDFEDDINFRAVMAPSEESGTDFPHENIWKNTVLNTTFNTFGTERYLTTFSYHILMDIAANAPADHILVLVNTDEYGGAGFYNFYSLAAAKSYYRDFLVEHEMGHGLSGLADEYYTSDVAVNDYHPTHVEPWEPNITSLVDFESKWDSLVSEDVPIPTPVKEKYMDVCGAFEGAGYLSKGLFRPAYDCTMKSVGYNNFCEACKRAVASMIRWYAH
ncbi:MAG: peptidase M64 [Marinilabiliales bacterium]|nr:MAG: peptidase M64 [Marinilabiliales bacterium]